MFTQYDNQELHCEMNKKNIAHYIESIFDANSLEFIRASFLNQLQKIVSDYIKYENKESPKYFVARLVFFYLNGTRNLEEHIYDELPKSDMKRYMKSVSIATTLLTEKNPNVVFAKLNDFIQDTTPPSSAEPLTRCWTQRALERAATTVAVQVQELEQHRTAATEIKIPEAYICPITQEIMRDPVVDREGHSFDREAIRNWLAEHNTCPLSRKHLRLDDLASNFALRDAINEFIGTNPSLQTDGTTQLLHQ